jgi:hypothetical protein
MQQRRIEHAADTGFVAREAEKKSPGAKAPGE